MDDPCVFVKQVAVVVVFIAVRRIIIIPNGCHYCRNDEIPILDPYHRAGANITAAVADTTRSSPCMHRCLSRVITTTTSHYGSGPIRDEECTTTGGDGQDLDHFGTIRILGLGSNGKVMIQERFVHQRLDPRAWQ